jgi:Ribonuclease G/E
MLEAIRPAGTGGFIVRTAGEERNEDEFRADLKYLTEVWEQIRRKAEKVSAPTAIHHDLDLVLRTIRDVLSPEFKSVWVDSVDQYQRIVEFLDQIQPNLVSRVRLYPPRGADLRRVRDRAGDREGAEVEGLAEVGRLHRHQSDRGARRDRREHRQVRRQANLEETVFRTNLEAAKEIVRQIRLRDLGGIIVLDFIDMEEPRIARSCSRRWRTRSGRTARRRRSCRSRSSG